MTNDKMPILNSITGNLSLDQVTLGNLNNETWRNNTEIGWGNTLKIDKDTYIFLLEFIDFYVFSNKGLKFHFNKGAL